jgi:hypothetical protein
LESQRKESLEWQGTIETKPVNRAAASRTILLKRSKTVRNEYRRAARPRMGLLHPHREGAPGAIDFRGRQNPKLIPPFQMKVLKEKAGKEEKRAAPAPGSWPAVRRRKEADEG